MYELMKMNIQKDNDKIINILQDAICNEGIPVILEGDLIKASGLKKSDFQKRIGVLESNKIIASVKRGKLTWYFLSEIIAIYEANKCSVEKEKS